MCITLNERSFLISSATDEFDDNEQGFSWWDRCWINIILFKSFVLRLSSPLIIEWPYLSIVYFCTEEVYLKPITAVRRLHTLYNGPIYYSNSKLTTTLNARWLYLLWHRMSSVSPKTESEPYTVWLLPTTNMKWRPDDDAGNGSKQFRWRSQRSPSSKRTKLVDDEVMVACLLF